MVLRPYGVVLFSVSAVVTWTFDSERRCGGPLIAETRMSLRRGSGRVPTPKKAMPSLGSESRMGGPSVTEMITDSLQLTATTRAHASVAQVVGVTLTVWWILFAVVLYLAVLLVQSLMQVATFLLALALSSLLAVHAVHLLLAPAVVPTPGLWVVTWFSSAWIAMPTVAWVLWLSMEPAGLAAPRDRYLAPPARALVRLETTTLAVAATSDWHEFWLCQMGALADVRPPVSAAGWTVHGLTLLSLIMGPTAAGQTVTTIGVMATMISTTLTNLTPTTVVVGAVWTGRGVDVVSRTPCRLLPFPMPTVSIVAPGVSFVATVTTTTTELQRKVGEAREEGGGRTPRRTTMPRRVIRGFACLGPIPTMGLGGLRVPSHIPCTLGTRTLPKVIRGGAHRGPIPLEGLGGLPKKRR